MCGRAILQGLPCAPAARPRGSCNQASLRKSCPQGVTIPNANAQNEVHFFPVFVILCHFIYVFLDYAGNNLSKDQ